MRGAEDVGSGCSGWGASGCCSHPLLLVLGAEGVWPPQSQYGASLRHATRQRQAVSSPQIQEGWGRALRIARAAKNPGHQLDLAPVAPAVPGRGRGDNSGAARAGGSFSPCHIAHPAISHVLLPPGSQFAPGPARGCQDSVPPQGTSSGSRRPENGPPVSVSVTESAGAVSGG